jgi:hypothetical protein
LVPTLRHLNNVEKRTGAGGGSGERERLSLPDYSAPSWSHDASDDEEDDIERLHLLRNKVLKMAEAQFWKRLKFL